jgi:hypothetical protein
LRTRCFVDTQGESEETEHPRDSAKADASHQKQLKGEEAQVHLIFNRQSLAVRLKLPQTRLGLFAGLAGAVSLFCDSRQLLAPVAIWIGSLCRFVFPLIAAVSDFGQGAHGMFSEQAPPRRATGDHSVK